MNAFGERVGWPAALFSLKCFAAANKAGKIAQNKRQETNKLGIQTKEKVEQH